MAEPDGWRVVSQNHTERYMPNGSFEDVVEVHIQADDGTGKTLVVPQGRYTRDNVVDLGNEWVTQHRAVAAIGNLAG